MSQTRTRPPTAARLQRLVSVALGIVLATACADRVSERSAGEPSETPRPGGRLVAALRGEPRTFNPVVAVDRPAQLVGQLVMADLLHINRASQEVEPALASSWSVSDDGLTYRLELRRDVRFSDGEPFDADDVMFSYRVYLDEEVGYPGRALLLVGDQPIEPRKIDSHTVEFRFFEPAAVGARLFDSLAILPEHRLREPYEQGRLGEIWGVDTAPEEIVGLGPFRLQDYRAGERLVLQRNTHYWKVDVAGNRQPYLDELVLPFVSLEDTQTIRFKAGETDVIERLGPGNFASLERAGDAADYEMHDLGPGLEYAFLVFNQNEEPPGSQAQETRRGWFRQREFRQAVSAAIDRQAIVRLVFRNRATPLWSHVSPGNRYWHNEALPRPERSLERARRLLTTAGFGWGADEQLLDPAGTPVEFTLITNSSNSQRVEAATLIQEDLRQLGIEVTVVSLEFRAMIDRLLQSRDYDVCLMGLSGGDADPNPQINVLLSSGSLHFWQLGRTTPATSWEAEIDQLMRQQISVLDRGERKRLFDRVQQIMAEQEPMAFLYSPHVLVGAKRSLGNFRPAVLLPHTVWNADELYWREPGG